jgi:dTDP-glucose 4,6-dehydratase
MSWKGKRTLITGAGGFIGSHLVEALVKAGANVRAMVHYNALGSAGWLDSSPIRKDIDLFWGDVTDADSVREAVKETEIVFHLAALIAIPYSYHVPASYVKTNVMGTINVLQAARFSNVQRIIHTSTSEVYGTAQYTPIDEAHPLQGQSPYSASKIAADKFSESFHLSFGLPVVTVRPFNTFGPRQSARAIIPTIITQCLKGDILHLGNLNPTRDMNFVSNTVSGFMLAALCPHIEGKVINLGSGGDISIYNLVRIIEQLMGKSLKYEQEDKRVRPTGSEVERLVADNTLARTLLGWKPEVDLEKGLLMTIEWIRNNIERYSSDGYVI